MSDSTAGLSRKIASASDLQSVVRTMKAMAASSIGQYETSVLALADYYHTVDLALSVCLREIKMNGVMPEAKDIANKDSIGAIVFGSDQGLVGQFNNEIADYAIQALMVLPGIPLVWAVGERVQARLVDAGITVTGLFATPTSIQTVTSLVGQIQMASEVHRDKGEYSSLYVFHNRPKSGALYEPISQRLLPLDAQWSNELTKISWPTGTLPETLGNSADLLSALIQEYLFISLFRACAESLASENASRLAAMQRAEQNIDGLMKNLHGEFHRLRQGSIDEELFDVVAGFEALTAPRYK